MPNFKYKVRDKFSKAAAGVIAAENKDAAAEKLHNMDYVLISIDEVKPAAGAGRIMNRFRRVSLEELGSFSRQLYALTKAGLSLFSSLSAISDQIKSSYFKAVIEEIIGDIKGGSTFSESLKKHPRIFNDIYVSMIKAAETGGSLSEILLRLTALIEQEIDTKNRIKSATGYPILAFSVLCLAFIIVVIFVIPRFAAVYGQMHASLPLPTRILIGLNAAITKNWYFFLPGIAGMIFVFLRLIESGPGRVIWDNFKLKMPVFGPLVTMLIMARFTRITALLMQSGVPILEILQLSAMTSGNAVISRTIEAIKSSVNQGRGISEPMRTSGLFPAIVIQMVAAGEETGRVDELLLSVADYYDLESGYIIKNLTTYIEPIMIFILSVMVLIMALAIFLPMWNLIKVFKPS